MALAALDSGSPRAAAGGVLFMLSDSLLALERFAGIQLPAHEGLVMATYTSAQALLARPRDPGSIVFRFDDPAGRRPRSCLPR